MTKLHALCIEREKLLHELAPTLRRAGPQHPNRAAINAQRTAARKRIKQDLRKNADEIATLVMMITTFKRRT